MQRGSLPQLVLLRLLLLLGALLLLLLMLLSKSRPGPCLGIPGEGGSMAWTGELHLRFVRRPRLQFERLADTAPQRPSWLLPVC